MGAAIRRTLAMLAMASVVAPDLRAQTPPPPLSEIEPGLEKAVRWKWHPEPSNPRNWGLELPVVAPTPYAPALPGATIRHDVTGRPDAYVVQRGDALAKIGKKFNVPVEVLKKVNGLESNLIRVGDVLRIPTPEEVAALSPTPAPDGTAPQPPIPGAPTGQPLDTLILQVFLDRQQFSAGPINAEVSPEFLKVVQLYLQTHPEIADSNALLELAKAKVPEPTTTYTLRTADFHFIAPPKAAPIEPGTSGSKKKTAAAKPPKPTLEDLTTTRMLAYRSPWEFVAERFHCSESYLRKLNPHIKELPGPGTEFRVPNVAPFEIERVFASPLQPPAGVGNPFTAAIVDRSRLEIRRGDALEAVMPLSIARPGLRGSEWVVLNAIPRPQLVTNQEPRVQSQTPTRLFGRESPGEARPTPTPVRERLVLGPGPRNPVGIIWINLAKAGEPEPLQFGLHGTSMPDEMATHESLGGIRMTNWDIARAVRMLPEGTPLVWTTGQPLAPPVAPQPPL